MKLQHSIELKATPDKVWYWLGDPYRAMMWQTSVTKGEIITQTPDRVGTTFRETVEEDGGSTVMEGVVTDYRENEALAMHLEGKYNLVDVEWRIEGVGENTRLAADFDIRFKGFLKFMSVVMRPAFRKRMLKQLQGEFVRLRELCESD